MKQKCVAYINGQYLSQDQAKISAWDLGLTRGYGVFEYLRTYRGKLFHLHDNLRRLRFSASKLHLKIYLKNSQIEQIILKLLKLNRLEDAGIKIFVTGGSRNDQFLTSQKTSFFILILSLPRYPTAYFNKGIKLIKYVHSPFLAECKTINYIPAILALQKAKQLQAFEALYINEKKQILECTTSNFFAFKKGRLITSKKNIVHGMTREIVLKLAEKKFPVEKREILVDEIQDFDEAFITASNKLVMPVVQIDDQTINNGSIGKNTKTLMNLFSDYTKQDNWPALNIKEHVLSNLE